ncbi:MAG: hypothetical protein ACTS3F_02030 [Phycisphaerales bacterium]
MRQGVRPLGACGVVVWVVLGLMGGGPAHARQGAGMDAGGQAAPAGTTDDGGALAWTDDGNDDAADRRLRLSFTPYAWLTSFSGTVGARGVISEVGVSFIDIVDDSDSVFGLMGVIDGSVDRFVFQLGGAYTNATMSDEGGRSRVGPQGGGASIAADVELDIEAAWLEAFIGYRFVERSWGDESVHRFHLDGFAGARYTTLDVDMDVTAAVDVVLPGGGSLTGGVERGIGGNQDWVEPFVGARAMLMLGEGWSFVVRGDVGGFGVDGASFAWQALGAVGYRWRFEGWTLSVLGGYRALGQDYEKDDFRWDVITHGPVLGLSFGVDF